MENVKKTIEFLLEKFEKCDSLHFKENPKDKQYRIEHTFRVASLGKEIAQKEGLDVEATIIGCLLHDLSYIEDFKTQEDWKNHGRYAAKLARPFLDTLELDDKLKNEILYGIAIHVDDEADFDGERTVLAETIGECDNIDRFDKFRLYEALNNVNLKEMTLSEQIDFCKKRIDGLKGLKENYVFKTETSNKLWNEKLDYQIEFFNMLKEQLETSNYLKLLS